MSVKFSYSRLSQYDSCPFAYDLKYNKGNYFYTPSVAAPFGSLVHSVLEQEALAIKAGKSINYEDLKRDFVELNLPKRNRYDSDLFGVKILAQKFPKEWHDFDTKSGKSYSVKAQEFLESGIYYFPKFMEQHPELEIIGAEVSFEYEYRGYTFMGFIDRLLKVRGEDIYIIDDIKTKDHPFDDKELITPLQFVCYATWVREHYGKDVQIECYYELPILGGQRQHAGTKGFEKRGLKKIDKILDGIEAGEYQPRPSPLCAWCSYRRAPGVPEEQNLCPYYSLWTPQKRDCYDVKNAWRGPEHHEEVMEQFREQIALEKGGGVKSGKFWDFDF